MTSNRPDTNAPVEAYVWIWLPGATQSVVAGRLARDGDRMIFNYGQSYIENLPPSVPAMLQEKESFEYVAGVYMDNIAKTSLEETRALLNSMSDGMVKQHEPGALVRQADYQQPLQAQAPEKQR